MYALIEPGQRSHIPGKNPMYSLCRRWLGARATQRTDTPVGEVCLRCAEVRRDEEAENAASR